MCVYWSCGGVGGKSWRIEWGLGLKLGRPSGSEEVLRDAKLRREDKLSGLDEVVEGVEEMEN